MNTDEKIYFLRSLKKDEELQKEFSRYQNTNALFALSDDVIDKTDSIKNYNSFIHRINNRTIRKFLLQAVSYAAAIVSLVLVVHYHHIYNYQKQFIAATETSVFVPAGQRICMKLADGTNVWLNAQTNLTYPTVFTNNERRVSIEGEAYFEVAKDKSRPFIVNVGDIEMKVLGTTFNVHSYTGDNNCRVSLLEGSLQVYRKDTPNKNIILSPQKEVTISNNQMVMNNIPSNDYFLWKEGIYSFDSEPLGNIFKRLEQYYDININVKDTDILKWKYTVKFRQRDGIDEILRLLCKLHPFTINKDEENNQIIISKYTK